MTFKMECRRKKVSKIDEFEQEEERDRGGN